MRPFKRPFGSIDELHAEQLECFRICWHRELAVAAALRYCSQHRLNAPHWLVGEAETVLCAQLRPKKRNKRGRASNAVARYRQDMIDYERWDTVREVREKQTEILKHVEELRAISRVPRSLLQEREKMLHWVGHDWLRVYECASMMLAKTRAAGGPEAMKASYQRVKRNSKDPDQQLRYHLLDSNLDIGLRVIQTDSRSKKVVPLYELIL